MPDPKTVTSLMVTSDLPVLDKRTSCEYVSPSGAPANVTESGAALNDDCSCAIGVFCRPSPFPQCAGTAQSMDSKQEPHTNDANFMNMGTQILVKFLERNSRGVRILLKTEKHA